MDSEEIVFNGLLKKSSICLSLTNRHTKLIGRKKELELLEESLYKKRMKNTILVGNAGVGKTVIVEELSHKVRNNFRIVQFDLATAVAGTRYRGEFEEKITDILQKISNFNEVATKPIILFIDEIHTLANAGAAEGAISAGDIVKPYLSKGEITIIGATTTEEYNKYIKKDSALNRRLSAIYIQPLKDEEIIQVLNKFSENNIEEEKLKYIYEQSKKIENSTNPDISIEILDRCIAKSKCRNVKISNKIIDDIVDYLLNIKTEVI